ncbi:hypothetical protein L6164_003856 [Bauhinia variegata]|uniref:Uncharacterized protein n=1 Tax=Bauhinia variegata TaxID=167791 RepID=A0ACB9Q2S8_BAUVA|nr:hypothetical protein L6164_003856 [Bauhinia variegata]
MGPFLKLASVRIHQQKTEQYQFPTFCYLQSFFSFREVPQLVGDHQLLFLVKILLTLHQVQESFNSKLSTTRVIQIPIVSHSASFFDVH